MLHSVTVLHRMPKAIRDCIGIPLLRSVIGPENLCHSLDQSDAKLKPTTAWLPAFSRALGDLVVFPSTSHGLLKVLSFLLMSRCNM